MLKIGKTKCHLNGLKDKNMQQTGKEESVDSI
jgi:hypothetical protein